jgi:hypothetical protein
MLAVTIRPSTGMMISPDGTTNSASAGSDSAEGFHQIVAYPRGAADDARSLSAASSTCRQSSRRGGFRRLLATKFAKSRACPRSLLS